MTLRTAPLFSWRLLLHERGRLLTSVGGITFALMLMQMQLGFRNALLDSSLELVRRLDTDIVVINKTKRPFLKRETMPAERLYQALSVEGVEAAYPLWLALLYWKNQETGGERPIRVIGFRPGTPVFRIDAVNAAADALLQPGTALIDERSRKDYGHVTTGPAYVSRRKIEIVGTFPLGSDFEVDGNLIVAEDTFFELADQSRQRIELALVRLAPGANRKAVVQRLRAALPGDVSVLSKPELEARDLEYWKRGTPISVILLVGVALGFAVGVVICYQILYNDVLDHLREFATLKAMGYGDRYIGCVVIVEAWVLSVLGFLPSVVLGWLMMRGLGLWSGLPAGLTAANVFGVGGISLSMCTLAAALALRKVRLLDPAELF
jgi:putative ABC transport system permease protein